MKKIIYLFIFILFTYYIFPQDTTPDSVRIKEIQAELDAVKKDVKELKDKTSWFSFKLEASSKITFGLSMWTKSGFYFHTTPITTGFDFDNRIRMSMQLSNKIVANRHYLSEEDATEISIKIKLKSLGLSELQPQGSWYVVDATTDQGKKVQVYLPREGSGSSNVLIGDLQFVFDEAKVSNIMGSGVYLNYSDVTEVNQYYGIFGLVDVLTLNNEYFNNGYDFFGSDQTRNNSSQLYYSFAPVFYDATVFKKFRTDYSDYEANAEISEAMKFWNQSMLTSDSGNSNQNPHGISGGWEKQVSDYIFANIEIGVASKDAFDPKYYEDGNLDYGFYAKGSMKMESDKFMIYPKLALSFAFQTDTTDDVEYNSGWNTLGIGVDLPFKISLPTGAKDFFGINTSWNMNVPFAYKGFSTIVSFVPELTILNGKLSFYLPFIYSYKNNRDGGFVRAGNESIAWFDQLDEDHVINFGFIAQFDSKDLFGDIFEYVLTNKIYFTDNHIMYYKDNYTQFVNDPEIFFYEIFRNEFVLNQIPMGPQRISIYLDFGYGLASNARIINSNYYYDSDKLKWYDSTTGKEVSIDKDYRWNGHVMSIETGIVVEMIKHLTIGFSAESPKILIGGTNPIGDQRSFGTFKLWSEIKL